MKEKIKERKIKIATLLIMMIAAMIIVILITNASTTVSSLTARHENSEEITSTLTYTISSTTDDNVTAVLTTDGALTISGTGAMTDYSSYSDVPWYAYASDITTITIESGVTNIGSYAFYKCESLTSVDLSNCSSLTSIGKYAFYWCESLTSIDLSSCTSLTTISQATFNYCESLTSIKLPDSVTSIESYAFRGCSSLASFDISENITSIGDYAFSGCTSLVLTDIPSTVTSIGKQVFSGCTYKYTLTQRKITDDGITASIPDLLKRTLDSNDVMYADGSVPTLTNCTVSYTDETMTFTSTSLENGTVSMYFTDGPLYGLTLTIAEGDTTAPVISSISVTTSSITISATDDISGIISYAATTTSTEPASSEYTSCTDSDGYGVTELTSLTISGLSEGTTYYIWLKDAAGNISGSAVTTSGTKSDTTAPSVTVSYSTTETTTGSVTVTLTADEQIQAVDGWTLSSDGYTLTKEYTENTTETVTITDAAGNTTEITVTIANISTETEDDTNDTEETTYYTITLNLNGGEMTIDEVTYNDDNPYTIEVESGSSFTFTGVATKDYCEFDGWEDENEEVTETIYVESVTSDLEYIASFIHTTYTITIDLDGGELVYSDGTTYDDDNPYEESVLGGYTYENTNTPTKDGYTFAGWEDDDGNITETIYVEEISSDMTFTAIWTEDSDSDDSNSTDDSSSNSATSNSSSSTNSSNSSSNSNSSNSSSSSSSNSSTSTNSSSSSSSLPYTGTKVILIGIIAVFGTIAVVVRRKWNDLNGI